MNHVKDLYRIDLHIHTTQSDGTRSLNDTIKDARHEKLRAISITYHNQFSIRQPVDDHGLEIIPGAEFSTSYTGKNKKQVEIHLIGLFFHGINEPMLHIFDSLSKQRERYIKAILDQLNNLNIVLSYAELLKTYRISRHIGRRHIAEFMLLKGYVNSIDEAFDCYIGNYSPYLIEVTDYIKYMPMKECVEQICVNGGFPILAHPYHYRFDDRQIEQLVSVFKCAAKGYTAGLEVYYSKYNEKQHMKILNLADRYRLLPSAGSDSHSKEESFSNASYDLLMAIKQEMKMNGKSQIGDDLVYK